MSKKVKIFTDRNQPPHLPANLINSIDRTNFRRLLQVVVSYIESKALPDNALSHITLTTGGGAAAAEGQEAGVEGVCTLFMALSTLCVIILTHCRKNQALVAKDIKSELSEEGAIPIDDYVDDVVNVVQRLYDKHVSSNVDGAVLPLIKRPPLGVLKLKKFRWRVDVIISNSDISRVLEPVIMFEVTLESGKRHIIQSSVRSFHNLRYNIALILQNMEELEARVVSGGTLSRSRIHTGVALHT